MTILSYGEIDLDIYLSLDRLPTMEHSANVRDEFENVGGAAANTAIWLANWGVPTRLAGHDLGDDRTGESVRQLFAAHGHLDTSFIRWHRDYVSPRCQCLVTPDGERSFIMHWLEELRINPATPEMMEGIAWLNLDMSGPTAPRLQASQLAKSLGIPVLVNDIYRIDHPILPLVDVLVISAAIVGHKMPGFDAAATGTATARSRGLRGHHYRCCRAGHDTLPRWQAKPDHAAHYLSSRYYRSWRYLQSRLAVRFTEGHAAGRSRALGLCRSQLDVQVARHHTPLGRLARGPSLVARLNNRAGQ